MLKFLARHSFASTRPSIFKLPAFFPEDEMKVRPQVTMKQTDLSSKRNKLFIKVREREKTTSKSKVIDKEEFFTNLNKELAWDPEVQLPLGVGFDDFIEQIKHGQGKGSREQNYLNSLKSIMQLMKLKNEAQLNQLNYQLIVQKSKNRFVNEARVSLFNKLKSCLDVKPYLKDEKDAELAQAALREGKSEAIFNLVKEEAVEKELEEIAGEKLRSNIEKYNKAMNPKRRMTLEEYTYEMDPYYRTKVSDSDQSDEEKLLGQRFRTDLRTGGESYETYESLQREGIATEIKRNYFRNKKEALRLKYSFDQYENPNFDFLKGNDKEEMLLREAESINMKQKELRDYDEIIDKLDYLIINAPTSLKQLIGEGDSHKGYTPRFEQSLWDEFNAKFETTDQQVQSSPKTKNVFPWEKYNFEKDLTMTQFTQQAEEDNLVPVYEQYVQNNQFFEHYLKTELKISRENQELADQQFEEGLTQHYYHIDEDKYKKDEDLQEQSIVQSQKEIEIKGVEQGIQKSNENLEMEVISQYLEAGNLEYTGQGKRKSCVANATITKGSGKVTVNGKNLIDYFNHPFYRRQAIGPVDYANLSCYIDIDVQVQGSSLMSQSHAVMQAVARALVKMCPSLKDMFKYYRFTITDGRKVERKHVGLYKARKKYPYKRR